MDSGLRLYGQKLDNERMGFAMLLAIATHAIVIFGVGFKLLDAPPQAPTLEVTLAQYRSPNAPAKADYLAQFNQQGSGNQPDKQEITADQIPIITDPGNNPPTIAQQPQGALDPPTEIVTTTAPAHSERLSTQEQGQPTTAALAENTISGEIGGLRARLANKRMEYSRYPKTLRLAAVSAKTAEQAAYLHDWVAQVEEAGNQHYPEEARRKHIFGDIRLAVSVHPDGSVDAVEILQSSGQRVLDQAAIRSVHMASPFADFPAEMRAWDRIEIIRTWHFMPGSRLQTR